MTSILDPLVLASIGGTLRTVIGVVLALAGLGVLLMGVIALADKSVQKGATAAVMGAGLIAAGLWLVEAF